MSEGDKEVLIFQFKVSFCIDVLGKVSIVFNKKIPPKIISLDYILYISDQFFFKKYRETIGQICKKLPVLNYLFVILYISRASK